MLKSPLTSVLKQTFSEKVSTNLDLILGLSVPLEHDASFAPAAFVSALVTFESQMKKI